MHLKLIHGSLERVWTSFDSAKPIKGSNPEVHCAPESLQEVLDYPYPIPSFYF